MLSQKTNYNNCCKLIFQYLKTARYLEGYSEVVFPHCACDSRRDGHVVAIIGFEAFKLQACKEDGSPEVSLHDLLHHG